MASDCICMIGASGIWNGISIHVSLLVSGSLRRISRTDGTTIYDVGFAELFGTLTGIVGCPFISLVARKRKRMPSTWFVDIIFFLYDVVPIFPDKAFAANGDIKIIYFHRQTQILHMPPPLFDRGLDVYFVMNGGEELG